MSKQNNVISEGMTAPDFCLQDKDGKEVRLSDFYGKRVVLYFYPKDNTPGCTRQACAFASTYDGFRKKDVEVIGISRDSAASHARFAEKYNLPFTLLCDPTLEVIKAYGAFGEKKMYGKVTEGVIRTTFIIGADGKIERVMRGVKPDTNAAEVLASL